MDDKDFKLLCESLKEAGGIKAGKQAASRSFSYSAPDVLSIRNDLGLSQSRFAAILGVSIKTLQNWEQGRRKPTGPAQALLRVVERSPEAVMHALG